MSAGDDKLIYIAAPYKHENPYVRAERVREATQYAAYLIDQDEPVFSPLSHSVEIERHRRNIVSPGRWYDIDLQILQACTEMHILTLPGWEDSIGIQYEIAMAIAHKIPIYTVPVYSDQTYRVPTPYLADQNDK